MVADRIGNRFKEYYENRSKTYLMRSSNVVVRIDGCHFHNYCKGLQKPFDPIFIKTMQQTRSNDSFYRTFRTIKKKQSGYKSRRTIWRHHCRKG